MTQSICTNTFGVAKIVVSQDATQGTHTTIATAITSASSGDAIWIRDGVYTENLTLKAGVELIGESLANTTIKGNHSFTATGTASLENISFITNAGVILTANSAGGSSVINATNCNFNGNDGNCWAISNASSTITAVNCQYGCSSTYTLVVLTAGQMFINGMFSIQASNSTLSSTASTVASGGQVEIRNSYLTNPFTFSTGTIILDKNTIDASHQNVTALTVSGATVTSYDGIYLAGTASAINISSGTLNSWQDIVGSSNTNSVTGAGTIVKSGMTFSGTSSLVNTTTQSGGIAKGGINGVAPSAGYIGEVLANSYGYQALVASTIKNLGSITLTPGNWDIVGTFSFNATGTNTTNVTVVGALNLANNSIASLDGNGFGSAELSGVGLLNFSGATYTCFTGPCNVSISASTIYYLNVLGIAAVTFNMQCAGGIRAVRRA